MINIWISVIILMTIIFWLLLDVIIENCKALKHDNDIMLKITTTALIIAEFATAHCIVFAIQELF